jgi:hypothetical protein
VGGIGWTLFADPMLASSHASNTFLGATFRSALVSV